MKYALIKSLFILSLIQNSLIALPKPNDLDEEITITEKAINLRREARRFRRRSLELQQEVERDNETTDTSRCLPVNIAQVTTIIGGIVTIAVTILKFAQIFATR